MCTSDAHARPFLNRKGAATGMHSRPWAQAGEERRVCFSYRVWPLSRPLDASKMATYSVDELLLQQNELGAVGRDLNRQLVLYTA